MRKDQPENHPKKQPTVFLVTNRHVLPAHKAINDSIQFSIERDSKSGYRFSIPIFDINGSYLSNIKFDPDSNDLAVIDITYIFHRTNQLNYLLPELFDTKFLMTKDSLDKYQIGIGDEILFTGYPSLLYDNRNASPIVRGGIIASFPGEDFTIAMNIENLRN